MEDVVEMFAAAYQAFPLVETHKWRGTVNEDYHYQWRSTGFCSKGAVPGWLDDGTGYHVQETIKW